MVSQAEGARFISLIGGTMLSFYDWYADLPVASPQVFGDQTDDPESADWWDSSYLVMWGTNVPVTRTPDAHFMTEARYRGQKVIVVSPDYADNTKFADEWLAPHPGTDGALAMAMGHVILKEFFVDQQTPVFHDYVTRYTDLPFLVRLTEREGVYVPGKFLTAAHLGDTEDGAESKTVLLDAEGNPVVPNGSLGFRFNDSGKGRWNLDLGDVVPMLTLHAGAPVPPRWTCPASTPRTAPVPCCTAAYPCARSVASWSPRCSTCCSRSTALVATACPATGRPVTKTTSRTPPPGRRASPRCPQRRAPRSPGSSPATPRSPADAR